MGDLDTYAITDFNNQSKYLGPVVPAGSGENLWTKFLDITKVGLEVAANITKPKTPITAPANEASATLQSLGKPQVIYVDTASLGKSITNSIENIRNSIIPDNAIIQAEQPAAAPAGKNWFWIILAILIVILVAILARGK